LHTLHALHLQQGILPLITHCQFSSRGAACETQLHVACLFRPKPQLNESWTAVPFVGFFYFLRAIVFAQTSVIATLLTSQQPSELKVIDGSLPRATTIFRAMHI
jgi:hypothetical protein